MRISDWSSDVCSSDLDLRRRAAVLAGAVLEIGGKAEPGQGVSLELATLVDGHAWTKFAAICEAQGGMRTPQVAAQTHPIVAARAGRVDTIDNPKLEGPAKHAGPPHVKGAGKARSASCKERERRDG